MHNGGPNPNVQTSEVTLCAKGNLTYQSSQEPVLSAFWSSRLQADCMLSPGARCMVMERLPGAPGARHPTQYFGHLSQYFTPVIPSLGCPFYNCKTTTHSCMI